MDLSVKPFSQQLIFFICFGHFFLPSVKTISDYNSLVYKDCASQTFTNNPTGSYSQTLSSLFEDLVSQSSHFNFFKTIAGDEQTAISGLFQCRGDLSNGDCYNCVNTLPEMANNLCREAVAARIQLSGCCLHYETDGSSLLPDNSEPKLLYKSCGEPIDGFKEKMNAAFVALESGVVSSNGFYTTNYESVHVLAQCEGDLGACDCGECVSNAVLIAQDECENSVSGQIYMDNCFMSYTYYPNGIPSDLYPEKKGDLNTGKAVAIVVGGVAALCFGFIFLLFIKSLAKKDDDY